MPTAGTLQSRAWRQDPQRPGKAKETWPTAGQPGWARSESTCTGTTHHLEEGEETNADYLVCVNYYESPASMCELCRYWLVAGWFIDARLMEASKIRI